MTNKLYTAIGIFKQHTGDKGVSYPYVEIDKQEYILNMQEMLLWTSLNWRLLAEDEIYALYNQKLAELELAYHTSTSDCLYSLVRRGLVAEGSGETGADALYDLLSGLYVVPISENIFLRLFSFIKLTGFHGVPYANTRKLLYRDKRSASEKKVMHLAWQTNFSTAEIIKCMELGKIDFDSDEEIMDTLYNDEFTTSENIAYTVKSSPVCKAVLTDVANLYLRQQIVFGRA